MASAKCFEVYTPNGVLCFRAYLMERNLPLNGTEPAPSPIPVETERKPNGEHKENGEAMSNAQQRYLFRILATQGIEGEVAHNEIMKRLRVASLKEVSKVDASRLIEQLLEEGKGGNGNGSFIE
ncbi:MAG: hypothetical protein L0Y80_01240 [Ignavibacteriae bacterium]|nr:hypothetical protein [Ignavibacteriota bacterium]